MLKKIEIFFGVILALAAVLILMASAGRRDTVSAPETTVPTTQATVPTTQATISEIQPETVPKAAPETQPPQVENQSTAPSAPVPGSQIRSQVEKILNSAQLEKTAVTRRSVGGGLNASEHTAGKAAESHSYALAHILEDRQVNPIAAFWKLVHGGLYEKQTDASGELSVAGFRTLEQGAKEYPYTDEGARQLLTDLLTLASQMEDSLALERCLLGEDLSVGSDQVFYSDAEQCRYAYFTCTSDRATYILCFYLRGAERIHDVEFQLLYLRHVSGEAEDLAMIDYNAKKQTAILMAASELLMTGKHRAGEGQIPFAYDIGGAHATLERIEFTGTPDRGSLTNYRLKIK